LLERRLCFPHIIAGKIRASASGICHCASLVLLTCSAVP